MANEFEVASILAKHGLKNTPQRRAVLSLLCKAEGPLTADTIFLKLRDEQIPVCLATVYRVLDQFCEKGLAMKSSDSGTTSSQYEMAGLHHVHVLRCLSCHETVPIPQCPVGKLEELLQIETDYIIRGHRLEIYGLCPKCQ